MARRPRSRARRVLRRIVLGVLGALVVAIASTLIVVHTDWGRNKIRGAIVDAMAKPFPCGVTIGALDGSVVGEVVIREVILKDCQGRAAVSIARIALNVKLTSLIGKTIRLEHLDVSGVRIAAHKPVDGPLNLLELLHLSPEPLGWAVKLDAVHLSDAAIATDLEGRIDHLDELKLEGSLVYGKDESIRADVTLGGRWREQASRLGVELEELRVATDATATKVRFALDGIGQVDLKQVRYQSPTDATATVTIDLAQDALTRFWPERSNPAVHLELAVRPFDARRLAVGVTATAGATEIRGGVAITPATPVELYGAVSVTAADARLVAPDTIATDLGGDFMFGVRIDPAAMQIHGLVAARIRGRIDDYVIDRAGIHAALAGRRLHALVDATGPGESMARIRGQLALADDGSITIDHARVDAHTRKLEQIAPIAGVAGAVDVGVDVTVSIPADAPVALTLDGRVTGRGLARGGLRAARAQVDLRRTVIDFANADQPSGGATVELTGGVANGIALPTVTVTADSRTKGGYQVGVTSSGDQLGPGGGAWAIQLGAVVQPHAGYRGATIELEDYTVRTAGVPWVGRGGTITATPTVVKVERVAGTVDRGRFSIAGAVKPGTGAIDATVGLARVDLAQLDRAFSLTSRGIGPLHGHADLTAAIHHRSRIPSSIRGTIMDLVFRPGGDPIDVEIDATATPTRVAGRVTATGAALGAIELTADVAPPRDLVDGSAWARLERRAIRTLTAAARDVDLVAIARTFGATSRALGKVSATIELGADRSVAEVHVRDLVVPRAPSAVDLDATFELSDPSVVVAKATATLRGLGRGTIDATVRVPRRPFDIAGWQALDATALRGATVVIDEIKIDDVLAARFELGSFRGRVAASVEIAEAIAQIRARATALGVTVGPLRHPIDLALDATLDDRGATATVTGSVDGAAVLTAEATAPIDPDRLTVAALRKVPITGAATLLPTRVDTLIRALGETRAIDGTISGGATFAGTMGDPAGTASVAITNLGGKKAKVKRIALDASYGAGVLTAKLDAIQEGGGGALAATLTYDRARPETAAATIKAASFQLSPALVLFPDLLGIRGILDVDLRLRGAVPRTATAEGTVRIQHATIPITDEIGAITKGSLAVTVGAGRAHLELDGMIESGEVELTADAELDGVLPRKATIDAAVRDLAIINTIAPRLAGELHAEVLLAGDHWKVNAKLRKTRVVIPDEEGVALHPASPPPDMVFVEHGAIKITPRAAMKAWLGRRPTRPFLRIGLDIAPVSIVSRQLRGEVSGHLDIAAGDDGISIDGELEAKQGEVMVFDRRYLLSRAAVAFDGGLDPELDVQMSHDFAELAMTVGVKGRLSNPELELSSDPAGYTNGQLLGFLLGGSPGGQGGDSKEALTGAAAAVASQTLGGFVTKKLPVKIDVFRYEPATSSSSAAFTVGKWVTSKLLVLVRSRIEPREDENTGETELEYWLGRRVLLDAVGGDKAVLGLDLLWTRRW